MAERPAVSTVRGLVLTTRRTPPKPHEAPSSRPVLVQQSPTKAATHLGREEGALELGLKHCRHTKNRGDRTGSDVHSS